MSEMILVARISEKEIRIAAVQGIRMAKLLFYELRIQEA
jgi:hypothetical protein